MADLGSRIEGDRKTARREGQSVASFIELCHHFDPEETKSQRRSSMDKLFRTIKGEIIPRLMLVYDDDLEHTSTGTGIRAEDVEIFSSLVLNDTIHEAAGFVDEMLENGVSVETVLSQLLTPTARYLGELWERDACSFTDVTIGLCRLHELLRMHSVRGHQPFAGDGSSAHRRALFATADGDQHVLGVLIVAELFRRNGWRVWSEPGISSNGLVDLVRNRPFDLLGLSAACGADPSPIAAQILALRDGSMTSDLKIIVGGALFLEQPELVQKVGADGFAEDAESAVQLANHFVTTQKHAT